MPLKIVGAAFGRTGTKSIKIALEKLGFGPCHHMFELHNNPDQIALWRAVARGEKSCWDKIFTDYQASIDWPSARYWRELAEHFENAKVLLTIRNEDSWFDSVQRTIYPIMRDHTSLQSSLRREQASVAHDIIVRQTFNGKMNDRSHAKRVYRNYIEDVRRTIKPERLLNYSVTEGWGSLCAFLDVPVPDEPFPFTNTTQQFLDRRKRLERLSGDREAQ